MSPSSSLARHHGTLARVLRSMVWSLPFVAGYGVLRQSWQEVALVAAGFCYLAFYEAFSDRLSRRSRYLMMLPLFIGITLAMLLLA